VHTVRVREAGDIGAIVDDDARLVTARELDHGGRGREKHVAAQRLGAQLQKAGTAAQVGCGQIKDFPAGAGGGVSVEDGGETADFSFQISDFGFRPLRRDGRQPPD
jgi:hypothetical protein